MSVRSVLLSTFSALGLVATPACAVDDEPPTDTIVAEMLQASCSNGVDNANELCPGLATSVIPLAGGMRALTPVDFNGDGLLDVAAITSNRVYVRLRTATGWAAVFNFHTIAGADLRDITRGDFDSDNDGDIVVTDFANDRVAIYYNNGTGVPAAPVFTAVGNGPTRVVSQRLDAGLSYDVVTLNSLAGTATLLLGGTFFIADYGVGNAPDITLVNCDGGPLDLAYSTGTGAGHFVRARPGTLAGSFGMEVVSPLPLPPIVGDPITNPLAIVAGRLDGDALGEVVVTLDGSLVQPTHNAGGCVFVAETMSNTWAYALRPDLADIDTDGDLDLIAPHGNSAISAIFGDGAAEFPVGVAVMLTDMYGAPPTVFDIAPVDITGDGNMDYLLATSTGVQLSTGIP